MSGFASFSESRPRRRCSSCLSPSATRRCRRARRDSRARTARVGPSGLPLPRFVSLKSGRVNSRIGPGVNYPVDWLYLKPGLPMEIIQEYDNWRRVRDSDGSEGWINQSLLSGRRTAIAAPWQRGKDARDSACSPSPTRTRATVAVIEPGVDRQDQPVQRRMVRDDASTATPAG